MIWAGGIAIGLIVGSLLSSLITAYVLNRRRSIDLEAIKARTEAENQAIYLGREAALKEIERRYAGVLQQLSAQQLEEAKRLEDNPGLRAELFARVFARKRSTTFFT